VWNLGEFDLQLATQTSSVVEHNIFGKYNSHSLPNDDQLLPCLLASVAMGNFVVRLTRPLTGELHPGPAKSAAMMTIKLAHAYNTHPCASASPYLLRTKSLMRGSELENIEIWHVWLGVS